MNMRRCWLGPDRPRGGAVPAWEGVPHRVKVRDVLSHPERVAVQFDSLTSHAEGLAICVINDLANVNNGVIGRD